MASSLVPPQASTKGMTQSAKAESTPRRKRRSSTTVSTDIFWSQPIWRWMASLKVGLVLLAILTIASIIGTLIDPLDKAQRIIYYSWWYKLLLLSLAVNMGMATVETVFKKLLPTRSLRLHRNASFYEDAKPNVSVEFNGDINQVAAEFQKQGCAVMVDGEFGVARRGWLSRLGGPVSHVGLIIVLGAGFVSSWFASEGWVRIPEGRTIDKMTLRNDDKTVVDLGFKLTLDDFSTGYFPRTQIPSHFISYVTASEKGKVLYQGPVEVNSSPLINGWRLHQTSYEELPNQRRQVMEVTPPGKQEAISVELSGGQVTAIPDMPNTDIVVEPSGAWKILKSDKVVASGKLDTGHDSELAMRVERFEPDFVFGADRKITSRSQDPNNPAVLVTLLSKGEATARQWLFQREDMRAFSHNADEHFQMEFVSFDLDGSSPKFTVTVADGHSKQALGSFTLGLGEEVSLSGDEDPMDELPNEYMTAGWTVSFGDAVPAHATVLTLTRNPILPIVYTGCGLMMIGLLIGFFIRRREVWFMVKKQEGRLCVVGHYRHVASELDAATKAIVEKLRVQGERA